MRKRTSSIDQVPLFRGCRRDQLRLVERAGTIVDVPAGHTLFRAGDTAREFIVVIGGRVRTFPGATLRSGSYIGHIGLIEGGVYECSATTATDARLLVFDQRAFRAMLERVPCVSRRLLEDLIARMRSIQSSRSLAAVS